MTEVKAGDLNLPPLESQHQWRKNYETLIRSENVYELMAIIDSASRDSMELRFYQTAAFDRIFATAGGADIREHIAAGAVTGIGAVAGAGAAATLGATTTSWGLFGVTLFTTIVTAPVSAVVGAGVAAGAAGYGAYKLISRAARDRGKEEHFVKTKKEGRYDFDPIRTLNPYVFSNDVIRIYQFLCTLSNPDWQKFLKLFDSNVLNPGLIETLKKSGAKDDEEELLYRVFTQHTKQYLEEVETQYNKENSELVNTCAAFMEINNEFALPRLEQEERKVIIDAIRKKELPINQNAVVYEEFLALFSLYKMLLNHPQNTPAQREQQRAKMRERVREFGDMAEKIFDSIVNETRIIKLDSTNYLRYLREIVDVLDQEQAKVFISNFLTDMAACMLIDNKLESYEQELLQHILTNFPHLHDTDINALLTQHK